MEIGLIERATDCRRISIGGATGSRVTKQGQSMAIIYTKYLRLCTLIVVPRSSVNVVLILEICTSPGPAQHNVAL